MVFIKMEQGMIIMDTINMVMIKKGLILMGFTEMD